jgi:hypothetical protein
MLRVLLAALVVESAVLMLKMGTRLAGEGWFKVDIGAPYDYRWDYLAICMLVMWAVV